MKQTEKNYQMSWKLKALCVNVFNDNEDDNAADDDEDNDDLCW